MRPVHLPIIQKKGELVARTGWGARGKTSEHLNERPRESWFRGGNTTSLVFGFHGHPDPSTNWGIGLSHVVSLPLGAARDSFGPSRNTDSHVAKA